MPARTSARIPSMLQGTWALEGLKGRRAPLPSSQARAPSPGYALGPFERWVRYPAKVPSAAGAVALVRAGGSCWLHWSQLSCSRELEIPRFRFSYGSCTRHVRLFSSLPVFTSLIFFLQSTALHFPSGLSWVSSMKLWPSSAQGGQEWLPGSPPPPYALPKLYQGNICPGATPHIAPLGTALTPKSCGRILPFLFAFFRASALWFSFGHPWKPRSGCADRAVGPHCHEGPSRPGCGVGSAARSWGLPLLPAPLCTRLLYSHLISGFEIEPLAFRPKIDVRLSFTPLEAP